MYRRRSGGRGRAMRLPVVSGLGVLCVVGLATGCSSSGPGGSPSSGHGSSTSAAAVTSAVSAGPSLITLPLGASPAPVNRTLTRPPGAKVVDIATCIKPTNIVLLYLDRQIFGADDVTRQLQQLENIDGLLTPELKLIRQARATWLADGYPADFPTVKELDGYISIYGQLHTAAARRDLSPVPRLYRDLQKVDGQYAADTGPTVCKQ
jgi:hypothetical protein